MSSELIELVIDEKLDGEHTAKYRIPATSQKVDLIEVDGTVVVDGQAFYIGEQQDDRDGPATTVAVEAGAAWYRLGEDTFVGSFVAVDLTPAEGLAAILEGTAWNVGTASSAVSAVFSCELEDLTRLELIRRWSVITGTLIVWDNAPDALTVDLVTERGRDLGLGFRYRRNVNRIRRRTRAPECTVLYPYGADELTIAGVNGGVPYVEDFSYYTGQGLTIGEARTLHTKRRVWSDTAFTVDTDLLTAAEARLAKLAQPAVTYELDVVDLTELIALDDRPRIGDRVRVQDTDLGVDVLTTVTRTVTYPLEPHRNAVELATEVPPIDDGAADGRPSSSEEWRQFVGRIGTGYQVRNDGNYVVARIPLQFRNGGRANWHLDLEAVGVGAGDMLIEVLDYSADPVGAVFRTITVPYTDGETVRAVTSWAAEDQTGQVDYRVRVSTTADGGPSPSAGVNITADRDLEAAFYVMAQGAVRETPTADNSVTYNYTGTVQQFTVPDNVTEITIEALGGPGGTTLSFPKAGGAAVTATFTVVPGTVYDVVVGGYTRSVRVGGWPNGGDGGGQLGSSGAGGGGSSHVAPTGSGATMTASALIVAGGGGGSGQQQGGLSGAGQEGGAGGFFTGADGADDAPHPGGGATQFAGGAGGGPATSSPGQAGTFGQGGAAGDTTNFFSFPPGGGGGGWYGGGGGGTNGVSGANTGGGGGGGSGWVSVDAYDVTATDGGSTDDGRITISWQDPL